MQRSAGRRQSPPPSKARISTRASQKEFVSPSVLYDTKDPFSGLSLLRKLLNNAARSGYRISPDEHKLSLHLLTIIEPFISAAPMGKDEAQRILTRQPNEILDMIAFHIDGRRDLLALALTCRRLRDIVLPRHLEYRDIHCKPSSDKVWRHLIAHPLLACHVRRLHIMDNRSREPEIIPSRADEEPEILLCGLELHKEHERLILEALAKMTTLTSFYWACHNSPISFEDVSPTLFTCEMLREVEISENQMFSLPRMISEDEEDIFKGSISKHEGGDVPDLTSVTIRAGKSNARLSKHPTLIRIQGLLISHCPNLTTLRVGYDNRRPFIPRADEFLQLGRWSNLRSLSLQNLWCSTHVGFEAASNFLAAHSRLEVLHFELGRVQLDLPEGTLPHLKELVCSREIAVAILSCPLKDDGKRPLETLKGFKLGGNKDDALIHHMKGYKELKKVEVSTFVEIEDIRKLAEAAPTITWLDVGRKASTPAKAMGPASVNEWAHVLSALPELTEFHGVQFFYEFSEAISHSDRSRIKKNDEVASMLAWKCPKLRRLDHVENSGKVVILGKESDRIKWELKRIKL